MNFPTKLDTTVENKKVWGRWVSHPEIRVLIQRGQIVAAVDDVETAIQSRLAPEDREIAREFWLTTRSRIKKPKRVKLA